MPAVSPIDDRLSRFIAWRDRLRRQVARARLFARRRAIAVSGGLMDYGPDWPPMPPRSRPMHPLLRRCVAIVLLYAVIWALGAVLLEFRLYELRRVTGVPVTTYTTITDTPRHHGHHH